MTLPTSVHWRNKGLTKRATVPYPAVLYGGDMTMCEDVGHKLTPDRSVYRITLRLMGPDPKWDQAVCGTVLVEGPRISFAQRA